MPSIRATAIEYRDTNNVLRIVRIDCTIDHRCVSCLALAHADSERPEKG